MRRSSADREFREGVELAERGELEAAVERFEECLRGEPDHVDALYRLARALDALARPTVAVKVYRRVLALVPGFSDAHNALGVVLGEQGLWAEAAEHHRIATTLTPSDALAFFNLGVALRECDRILLRRSGAWDPR